MSPLRKIRQLTSKRLRTLPARISFLVFTGTFLTTLVITWVTISTFHGFLEDRTHQKFPAILEATEERIEFWYSSLHFEMVNHANNARRLVNGSGESPWNALYSPGSTHTPAQFNEFLDYLLRGSSQYESLFLLDAEGHLLAWQGARVPLPPTLRRGIRTTEDFRLNQFEVGDQGQRHLASAVILDGDGQRMGSLHALLNRSALPGLLHSKHLGRSGRLFLMDAEGELIVGSPQAWVERQRAGDLRALQGSVASYLDSQGDRVLTSARPIRRFGWTLIAEQPYGEAFAPIFSLMWRVSALDLFIVLLFSCIAVRTARSISRPIQELAAGARQITEGKTDVVIIERSAHDEIALLTLAFNRMSKRLHTNRIELRQKQENIERTNGKLQLQNQQLQGMVEKLNQLSITDGLTQLYNHRYFQQQLRLEIARARRARQDLFIVLFDVDNFKGINDEWGHATGDLILQRVAEIMRSVTRENDLLARYGGEEFALVPAQTDLEGTLALAEKIRFSVAGEEFTVSETSLTEFTHVTLSVGVAPFTGDLKKSFNNADQALYRAKACGKDCVRLYGSDD